MQTSQPWQTALSQWGLRSFEKMVNGQSPELEGGFRITNKPLNCGNSGTTARFLMAMVAGIGENIRIDGDDSLRGRDMSIVAGALRDLGCSVSGDSCR